MNGISKTIVFLAVLVSDLFSTSSWAETTKLLDCSTSSAVNCFSFIYLHNVTETINSVASRLKISAHDIMPFNVADYLAKIPCSCSNFLGNRGFSYRMSYTVQSSDVDLQEISDKYFVRTACTGNQSRLLNVGDKVELALGCGCPIPGWESIVAYLVLHGDLLFPITSKFRSNLDAIVKLNNIPDMDVIVSGWVYFIPYQEEKGHHHRGIVMEVSVSLAGTIVLLLLLIIAFYYACRKRGSSLTQTSAYINDGQSQYLGEETKQEHQLEEGLSASPNLTYEEIIQMKGYCEQSYKIGQGSFGKVYRGNLKDKDVAIKKIGQTSKDSKRLVEKEVRLLHGKEHKNLVNLIALCTEENKFYLVYEYVNGCTLDEYLERKFFNSFSELKAMSEGHVDWEGTHKSTERITGTRGYWSPEYCFNHNLSYKNDIYSFGIVVLEVITGQRHVDNARGSNQFHIPEYLRYMIANNRFEQALDERLKGDCRSESDLTNALAVAQLALKCADKDKEERPDMDCVMRELCFMRSQNTEKGYPETVH
ncbi:hypothetical protein SUGI_0855020 [Cryptomeria japonica]|uniref:probable LRR receptor-like serine/threonine-protein kinase At1g51880 n=1 Tax=Cryptomeria japonica TaxID=3369 RepID=UPI002414B71E|nr:probable LRR receptor-like serine/threonine-protein kinase At1g51880 [Cryptomeria japonica]GLJ41305.1 hypothetical protein SUGI_0855020 [Cryptomeria japonica]